METIEFTPTNYPSDLTDAQWEQISRYFRQGPPKQKIVDTSCNDAIAKTKEILETVYKQGEPICSFAILWRKSGIKDNIV